MCMHVSISALVMKDEKAATKSSLKDGDFLCRGWNAQDHMHVALNPLQ